MRERLQVPHTLLESNVAKRNGHAALTIAAYIFSILYIMQKLSMLVLTTSNTGANQAGILWSDGLLYEYPAHFHTYPFDND